MALEEVIRKHSLKNASDYGSASTGGVVGKVVAEWPDAKKDMAATMAAIAKAVDEINCLPKEKIAEELKNYTFEEKKQREGLPELQFAQKGKLVTRIAPNPNGLMHIGHAKIAVICDEYAKKYGGKFILRLEDTDPKIKRPMPEAYKWIPEDIRWLGCSISQIVIQSERMPLYYDYAEKLIRMGQAYVCSCTADVIKENRASGKACGCRNQTPEQALREWKKMLLKTKEGRAVLRVKTDITHENPSVRDWIAFRIIEGDHPRVGKKYRAWPLYNFSSAIDDHLLGINLVIRGKEHEMNAVKQDYLYDYFKWPKPHVIEVGLVKVPGLMAHKSDVVKGIKEGIFTGWDDVRLPMLRSLKRRGIQPEAIRKYMLSLGLNATDSTLDWKILYRYNLELLEPKADHYFFVEQPVEIRLKGVESKTINIPKHPKHLEHGQRELVVKESVFVSKADFDTNAGKTIRLKDLANIAIPSGDYAGNDLVREMPKIQWVPAESAVGVKVFKPDGTVAEGFAEKTVAQLKAGDVVQFERFGYCRYDRNEEGTKIFYFTH